MQGLIKFFGRLFGQGDEANGEKSLLPTAFSGKVRAKIYNFIYI